MRNRAAAFIAFGLLLGSGKLAADPDDAKKPAPLQMNAEKVEIDIEAKTAVLTGHVELTRGDLKVSCPRVDARYDHVPHVTWAKGSGGVVAEVKGVRAESPVAEIDLAAQTVVLIGGVKLAREGAWLTADRATINMTTGKVTLTDVKASIPVPK